ncbi:MAG: polyketide cyclase, partial [Chryseobacterium sp.]
VIYYKGNYAGMINKVELLARHAKDNGYRPRELVQTFLTDPGNDDTIIKLSLYTD